MKYNNNTRIATEEYLKTYYIFRVGDIAFEGNKSKYFKYGRFVENTIGNGIVSHVFIVFRPIMKYDLQFWKYAINNENVMQKVLSKSTKSSTMMCDLVTNDFLEENVLIPNIKEQECIGSYLEHIDKLITLHQRK